MLSTNPSGPHTAQRRRTIALHALYVPYFVRGRSFESVLTYIQVPRDDAWTGVMPHDIAHWVTRATRKPWLMRDRRCLRQGLLGTRFMRMAGHDAELHFGVDQKSLAAPAVSAHCWVVIDGVSVLNDIHEGMVPIYVSKNP